MKDESPMRRFGHAARVVALSILTWTSALLALGVAVEWARSQFVIQDFDSGSWGRWSVAGSDLGALTIWVSHSDQPGEEPARYFARRRAPGERGTGYTDFGTTFHGWDFQWKPADRSDSSTDPEGRPMIEADMLGVCVPFYGLFLLFAILPAVRGLRAWRRRRERRRGFPVEMLGAAKASPPLGMPSRWC